MRAGIRAVRDDLLAEHLGVDAEAVAQAQREEGGSLLRAVERLRTESGRTLRTLQPPSLNTLERITAERHVLDPEQPVPASQAFGKMLKSGVSTVRQSIRGRSISDEA